MGASMSAAEEQALLQRERKEMFLYRQKERKKRIFYRICRQNKAITSWMHDAIQFNDHVDNDREEHAHWMNDKDHQRVNNILLCFVRDHASSLGKYAEVLNRNERNGHGESRRNRMRANGDDEHSRRHGNGGENQNNGEEENKNNGAHTQTDQQSQIDGWNPVSPFLAVLTLDHDAVSFSARFQYYR